MLTCRGVANLARLSRQKCVIGPVRASCLEMQAQVKPGWTPRRLGGVAAKRVGEGEDLKGSSPTAAVRLVRESSQPLRNVVES